MAPHHFGKLVPDPHQGE
jgi:hypothetical protein